MNPLMMLALGLLAASPVQAASVDCSGNSSYPAQIVSGHCNAGLCSADLPSVTIPMSGSCADSSSFKASASSAPGTMTGRCHDGEFLGIGSTEILKFNGGCSTGASFTGSFFLRPQWTSGTCSENGTFTATITPWNVSVSGSCNSAADGSEL